MTQVHNIKLAMENSVTLLLILYLFPYLARRIEKLFLAMRFNAYLYEYYYLNSLVHLILIYLMRALWRLTLLSC